MKRVVWHGSIFAIASLSFACLLGQFFGFWSMREFACWILLPAIAGLTLIAWRHRHQLNALGSPGMWIVHGTIGGILAAVVYDLYRVPFVLNGAPIFKVFARFGELLLGSTEPRWLVHTLGWTYHFSNGAALGIMFLACATLFPRPPFFWGALAWALGVECILLATPYSSFFGLKMNLQFLLLTASAHAIFGIALGSYYRIASRHLGWNVALATHLER